MPDGSVLIGDCFVRFGTEADSGHRYYLYGGTPEEAWATAAEFTRKRQQDVADIEEEIKQASLFPADPLILNRILIRLNRERDELKRGMK
jgi:DNA polymerase elongation subunit (family B)